MLPGKSPDPDVAPAHASKTLTVAVCGPQSVTVPRSFTPDACRLTARAIVGAVGAAMAKGSDILFPASFGQGVANVRAAAWNAGDKAWAMQLTRDGLQAAALESRRRDRAPRRDDVDAQGALAALLATSSLDPATWQSVRNTLGHPFGRDVTGHVADTCDVCSWAVFLATADGASTQTPPAELTPGQVAAATLLMEALDASTTLVLDLYKSLRAATPVVVATAPRVPSPAIVVARSTWEPEVFPL